MHSSRSAPALDQVGHELRGDRDARPDLAILSRVAVVGNHRGDAPRGARFSASIMISSSIRWRVLRRAGGLEREAVHPAHVLADLDGALAVAEGPHLGTPELDVEIGRDRMGELELALPLKSFRSCIASPFLCLSRLHSTRSPTAASDPPFDPSPRITIVARFVADRPICVSVHVARSSGRPTLRLPSSSPPVTVRLGALRTRRPPLATAPDRGDVTLAGAVGFEPTNGGSKGRCLTIWRRPKKFCRSSACAESMRVTRTQHIPANSNRGIQLPGRLPRRFGATRRRRRPSLRSRTCSRSTHPPRAFAPAAAHRRTESIAAGSRSLTSRSPRAGAVPCFTTQP